MMQEVEVLKTIPELVCSYFSEEQFTLSYFVYSIVIYFNSLYIIYGALFCTSYKYQDVYKP